MDIQIAIKKPFSDIKKLIIGILLYLVPIVNLFAEGFILVSSGVGKTKVKKGYMAAWKNWQDLFVKGLMGWLISFIYFIPAMILMVIGTGAFIIQIIAAYVGNVIPKETIQSVVAGQTNPEIIALIVQQNWAEAIPAIIALSPFVIIALVLALIAAYVMPIAVLNYIKTEKFAEGFDLDLIRKKCLTGDYLLTWIVAMFAMMVTGFLLGWIPIIGGSATYFIGSMIGISLFAEVYQKKA